MEVKKYPTRYLKCSVENIQKRHNKMYIIDLNMVARGKGSDASRIKYILTIN